MPSEQEIINLIEYNMQTGESMGMCIQCAYEQPDVEPDAREYECDECGHLSVYGAEELLIAHPQVGGE